MPRRLAGRTFKNVPKVLIAAILASTFIVPAPSDLAYGQPATKSHRATTYKLQGPKLPRRLLSKFNRDRILSNTRTLAAEVASIDTVFAEKLLEPRPMRNAPDGPVVKKAQRRRAPRCPADAEAVFVGSSLHPLGTFVEPPPASALPRPVVLRIEVAHRHFLPRPRDALADSARMSIGLAA